LRRPNRQTAFNDVGLTIRLPNALQNRNCGVNVSTKIVQAIPSFWQKNGGQKDGRLKNTRKKRPRIRLESFSGADPKNSLANGEVVLTLTVYWGEIRRVN
jgi:spermidine/putrescine-binding protein